MKKKRKEEYAWKENIHFGTILFYFYSFIFIIGIEADLLKYY